MSLKGFHIVFITFSTLLAFGVGVWCLWINHMEATTAYAAGAVCSFAAAVALIVYGCWFWRKMKRLRLI
jgi:membrane protein YdbS with pleckstrin-like domain